MENANQSVEDGREGDAEGAVEDGEGGREVLEGGGEGGDAALARHDEPSLNRKMRGLKRKRRTFTRSLSPRAPSGGNQKVSGFDFAASREENALRPTDNAQQTIRAAIAPAQAWSPLAKVKRDRRNLYTAAEVSQSTISLLQSKCKHNQERINNLKRFNNQLLVDLLRERMG